MRTVPRAGGADEGDALVDEAGGGGAGAVVAPRSDQGPDGGRASSEVRGGSAASGQGLRASGRSGASAPLEAVAGFEARACGPVGEGSEGADQGGRGSQGRCARRD